jgi:hypothetical protein
VSALSFKKLPTVDGYEVRRDGVLLGRVERETHVATTRRENSATIRKVERWRWRRSVGGYSSLTYTTRKAAARILCISHDAHAAQQARKEART